MNNVAIQIHPQFKIMKKSINETIGSSSAFRNGKPITTTGARVLATMKPCHLPIVHFHVGAKSSEDEHSFVVAFS
jgi:hypothetical protein